MGLTYWDSAGVVAVVLVMDMMRVGPRMCVKWAAVMGSVAMRIQVIDELVLFVFEKFEEDVMV